MFVAIAALALVASACQESFFNGAAPNHGPDTGATGAQVGMRFMVTVPGTFNGVRFYKGSSANGGAHTGSLWDDAGNRLATATFANESASGWQDVQFSSAVSAVVGKEYIVSYYAPQGNYTDDAGYFSNGSIASIDGAIIAFGNSVGQGETNGVYNATNADTFPNSDNPFCHGCNYWVDIDFTPAAQAAPDGGNSYYMGANNRLSNAGGFFPIGTWNPQFSLGGSLDMQKMTALGINVLVNDNGGFQQHLGDFSSGQSAIGQPDGAPPTAAMNTAGSIWSGSVLADEMDAANPNNCTNVPSWAQGQCSQNADGSVTAASMSNMVNLLRTDDPSRYAFVQLTKPTSLGECNCNWHQREGWALAGYSGTNVVLSEDFYPLTDPFENSGSNGHVWKVYDAIRGLRTAAHDLKPAWAFIEVFDAGASKNSSGNPIRPTYAQVRVEAIQALIGGARGIEWFGMDQPGIAGADYDALVRDPATFPQFAAGQSAVHDTDALLASIAPILNSNTIINGVAATVGTTSTTAPLNTMVKSYNGKPVVFAAPNTDGAQTGSAQPTFKLSGISANTTATVIGENRTVAVTSDGTNGTFHDDFGDANTFHIYQVN
jgi:hypothetical protein